MKNNRKWLIIGLIILLIIAVVFLMPNSNDKQLHTLDSVLVYVEQNGAEYAEDRLDYLIVYSYKKDELYKTWGTPSENLLNTEADMWVLSETEQLIAYYDNNDEVEKIEILTVTAFD